MKEKWAELSWVKREMCALQYEIKNLFSNLSRSEFHIERDKSQTIPN